MNALILESRDSRNGHVRPVRRKTTLPVKATGRAKFRQAAKLWAARYVGGAIGLSSVLNAYAVLSSSSATGGWQYVGVAFAGLVPVGVWVLAKQAASAYRGGKALGAYSVALAAVALLVLSLFHCSAAIAGLTGSDLLLSWCMALGIDYGLVASELLAVQADEQE